MLGGRVTAKTMAVAGRGKSRSLLTVLTVVFVIAWGMLTVLIVLQDRMIDAQRDLIHVLFKDNVHEAALKSASPSSVRRSCSLTSPSVRCRPRRRARRSPAGP